MNTIDIILLTIVLLFGIWGFIRGAFSQAVSIVALIAVYFFSVPLSLKILPKAADFLGSSSAYARPFAVLWSAIMIFIAFKLAGFLIERVFIDQSDALKLMNRFFGGILGLVKGACVLIIAFYILLLVPKETLRTRAPKMMSSRIYQGLSSHQILDPKYIDTLVEPVTNPIKSINPELAKEIQESVTKAGTNKKALEKREGDMDDKELQEILGKQAPQKPTAKAKH